jgi:hypothetical protein
VGATLIVTAALHDEWRKLDRIEQAIDRLGQTGEPPAVAPAPVASSIVLPRESVPAPGGSAVLLAVDAPRIALVGAGGLAAAALVAGGWRATASAVTDSTAYSTVRFGVAGVVLAAVVSVGWTLSLRRAARCRRAVLLAPFATAGADRADPGVPLRPAADGRVAVAEGLTRFHSPGCAALGSLAVRLVDEVEARRAGHTPCHLCDPAG